MDAARAVFGGKTHQKRSVNAGQVRWLILERCEFVRSGEFQRLMEMRPEAGGLSSS